MHPRYHPNSTILRMDLYVAAHDVTMHAFLVTEDSGKAYCRSALLLGEDIRSCAGHWLAAIRQLSVEQPITYYSRRRSSYRKVCILFSHALGQLSNDNYTHCQYLTRFPFLRLQKMNDESLFHLKTIIPRLVLLYLVLIRGDEHHCRFTAWQRLIR